MIKNLSIKEDSYLSFFYDKKTDKDKVILDYKTVADTIPVADVLSDNLTPRKIEKLINNPFYFFLEYNLKLKELPSIDKIFKYNIKY